MKRMLGLLVVLAGCHRPDAAPVAEPRAPAPQPAEEIDFAGWPKATPDAIHVAPQVSMACRVQGTATQIWTESGGEKRHGPHLNHYIVIRVSPESVEEFKLLRSLPVGTVVVKEKHADFFAKGPPAEYAAMVKREPGYDPEHGDWEYVYVVRGPERKVTRGRLESCIRCHEHAKDRDYVFRTYIKAAGVAEW